MLRYLEESHGTSTSNGQDGEDTKYEGQEEELSWKLQAPDDRPSPDVRPLKATPTQGSQATECYSGWMTDQARTSDNSQAPDDRIPPDDRRYANRTKSTEIRGRPDDRRPDDWTPTDV